MGSSAAMRSSPAIHPRPPACPSAWPSIAPALGAHPTSSPGIAAPTHPKTRHSPNNWASHGSPCPSPGRRPRPGGATRANAGSARRGAFGRGSHQPAAPPVRAPPLPLPRRSRDGAVGGLGHPCPQPAGHQSHRRPAAGSVVSACGARVTVRCSQRAPARRGEVLHRELR